MSVLPVPLVWTAEARTKLLLRSRDGVGAPKRPPIGTAWGSVRKALSARRFDVIAQTFVSGRKDAKAPFAAWMEKCEAIARSRSMPRFDDADVAATFAVLMSKHVDHALLTSIYPRQQGVVFTFEVALAMLALDVSVNRPFFVYERRTPAAPDLSWRDALLAEPDEVRAACADVGARLWPSASLAQKTTIAYALFEQAAWVDEVCRAWLAAGDFAPEVLYPLARDKQTALELVRKRTQSRSLLELVETFGEEILPLLVELAGVPLDNEARHVAEALAQFDDPRAAAGLALLVKYAAARPFVHAYFGRYPHLADALTAVAADKKRSATIAKEVLAGAKRARGVYGEASEATLEELPPLFATAPWSIGSRRKKRRVPSLALTPMEQPMTVIWHARERDRVLAIARSHGDAKVEATDATIATHARAVKQGRAVGFYVHMNQRLPDASVLAAWNAGVASYGPSATERLQYALAKFGEGALEGLVRHVDRWAVGAARRSTVDKLVGEELSFLLRVTSPRIALGMAKLRRSAMYGPLAWQWLRRHEEVAVTGLVPAALGARSQDDAARTLLHLSMGRTDVLGMAARMYGDEAKAALEELLLQDPLHDAPKTVPKLGSSWNPATLTRPVMTTGKVLPLSALDAIGTMLAFSPLDPPYAGLATVKALCTERSLAELAWDLARSWEHAGYKLRDKWMLMSLVHFADDEVVRRITPAVRVDCAVDVLARIDTHVALMELATIAGRVSASGDVKLAARVEAILERAAAVRGLEKDELEEDLVPATEVAEDGTVSLDFGARRLKVGFDEHLDPYVVNAAGNRVRALAPARAGDDSERVMRAKTAWRDLKEDVAVLAARRVAGLKRAMLRGRTWTAARFQRVWIDNGLMKHLAGRVVWTDGTTAFRVAQDGLLSTSRDVAFTLAEGATVMALHPLRAPPDEVARWRALFADYRIMQPFAQLERAPFAMPTGDRMPWPFAAGNAGEFGARLLERGFTRAGSYGKWGFRHELVSRGAIAIEFKGGATSPAEDIEIVFLGDNLDVIEIADILDEVQAAAPISERQP